MAYGYDLVGQDELFAGDDLDDVLGAYDLIGRRAVARAQRGRGAMARQPQGVASAAQAAAMARNAVVLQDRAPTRSRRLYLPLGATVVASLASTTINVQPQSIAFKPERIVIPATIAPDFTIDQILVGNQPQSVASGSAPAESFVANAVGCELDCDTLQTSQTFTIAATNISGATRTFRGTVFGRSVS